MLKKIVLEKIYLLLTIIAIGGYSAMSMLYSEHESIYAVEDPIVLKLSFGLLFILALSYLVINNRYISKNRIGNFLMYISCYLAISKVLSLSPTANMLSYFYQPMQVFLFVILFALGQIITSKPKEILEFFSTGMFIALLITTFLYYKNWSFNNETNQAHLGSSYYALFIFLPILFSKNRFIKYLSIAIVGAIIISSLKRGGLIAFILGLVAYLFVKNVLLEHKLNRLIWFITIIFFLFILLIYIDNAMGNIISTRLMNISEDGGSGRDGVWATTWEMICRSDAEQLVFGHGYSTVVTDSPLRLSAHNDFLEILYDWGIAMFIPYVILHYLLIKQVFQLIKSRNTIAPIMSFVYVIFIILSLISIIILYPFMALISLIWGMSTVHNI